jgi:rhamnogalacturonyl hydrolase YesR
MTILYIILIFSLGINLLFIFYDILPYIIPSLKRRLFISKKKKRNIIELENLILKASMSFIKDKKSKMPWRTGGLYNILITRILRKSGNKEFRDYNYPRGYILYGLSEYLIRSNDTKGLIKIKNIFDKLYIKDNGEFAFDFNKVDQTTFGLTALNLYKISNEKKYKVFADNIYTYLHSKYNKDKLVLYRNNAKCELNDTIGMIVPFLVRYYQSYNNSEALSIAKNQMIQFIENGVDNKSFIPSHGYNLQSKIKTGSSNWGRGIGWYFIGLKELYELDGSFKNEYEGLCSSLQKVKNEEGLWGQFPGSNDKFDASTSTLFMYCFPYDKFSKEKILNKLDKYISNKGYILETSGDTEGLNFYSKFTGKSEFTQGILQLILSRYK